MFVKKYDFLFFFVSKLAPLLIISSVLFGCSKPNYKTTTFKSQSSISVAEQLIMNGQYEDGYQMLDQISASSPQNGVVQLKLAESYFRQGAYMKANRHYHFARGVGFEFKSYLGLGRVFLALNEPEKALHNLNYALQYDGDHAEVLNGIGVAYDLFGRHLEAQHVYKDILSKNPNHMSAYNNYALSLAFNGEGAKAHYMLKQLLSSHLNNNVIRQNLALISAINGQREEAIELASVDMTREESLRNFEVVETQFSMR